MPLIEKNIAKRIERLRMSKKANINGESKYLSREQLAELLHLTNGQYDIRSTGNIPFSIKSLNTISKVYDADVNFILFGGIK